MSELVVNGLIVSYEIAGNGKPLLLLHGWGDSKETFDELKTRLTREYQTICVDLPGFGKTQAPPQAWSLNDYADFVGGFCKKLQLSPYAVIGHSNGGAIAIRGLSSRTLEAAKAVLIASSGVRNTKRIRKKLYSRGSKVVKPFLKLLPKKISARIRRRAYAALGSDMFVAPHLQETFKNIVADDIQGDAKNITIPCLLLYGAVDTVTPVSIGEQLNNQLPNARLEVIEGTSHFLHQEKPDIIHDKIKNFLL